MATKRERAEQMEPNRFKQAQSMVTHAGAPMNNTPQNVNSLNDQRMTLDPNQGPSYPYMDSGLNPNDPRARAPIPNENTGMPQFMTVGRGHNQNAYGLTPMPDAQSQGQMTGSYLGQQAQGRGLYASMMGPTGMPTQPAPGGSTPESLQTAASLSVQGVQSAEVQQKGTDMKSGKRTKKA